MKKNILRSNAVFLAPTGIAAINIGESTIHSFSKFPPRFVNVGKIKEDKNPDIYQKIKYLVIDECSMLTANLLDAIDVFLKKNRQSMEPLGGVQLILFGDLYQLPPVIKDDTKKLFQNAGYTTPYFFDSYVFKKLQKNMYVAELSQIFRQKDVGYIDLLNEVRLSKTSKYLFAELDERVIDDSCPLPDDITILTTTNKLAKKHNDQNIKYLPAESQKYEAIIQGDFFEADYPTEQMLELKKYAKVIFIKNDSEKRWINGTIGYVDDLCEDSIRVRIGKSTQAFLPGQIYVALSRCKCLENLYLLHSISPSEFMVNLEIKDFMQQIKKYNKIEALEEREESDEEMSEWESNLDHIPF